MSTEDATANHAGPAAEPIPNRHASDARKLLNIADAAVRGEFPTEPPATAFLLALRAEAHRLIATIDDRLAYMARWRPGR